MASRLFWRSRDSSSGNANQLGRTEIVGARLCRTICDHPLKLLLIYCRCLFSERPGLSFGPASILISQLGPSCFCKEKAICMMKWQQIKHRNIKETRWRSGRASYWFTFLSFFYLLKEYLSFSDSVLRYAGSLCANSSCMFNFSNSFVLRQSQFFSSPADYELDKFPQPIRMLFSGLQKLSLAQLKPHLKNLPHVESLTGRF